MNPVDYACFLYAHATIWRKGSLSSESRCDSGAGLIGRSELGGFPRKQEVRWKRQLVYR